MSEKTVTIERAKSAPPCVLWDGRKTHAGDPLAPVPLTVTVSQASDLTQRDPSEWVVPVKADADLVTAETKRRAAPAPAPAESGGGN